MKRLLCLVLSIILIISSVCGCQKKASDDPTPSKKEEVSSNTEKDDNKDNNKDEDKTPSDENKQDENKQDETTNPDSNKKDDILPNAPEGATSSKEEDKILSMGGYQVVFVKENHGYAVNIVRADSKKVLFRQEKMAEIKIRGKGSYTASYSSVEKQDYGYLAEATVTTESGSVFSVKDAWYVVNNSSYGMKRTVTVTKASSQDVGFASVVTLLNGEGATSYDKFDFFIPSILYKDSEAVVSGAIASTLDWEQLYVKETRTGLPMVMARSKESGYSLALTHLEPEISVGGVVGGGGRGTVNDKLQYGAIGITSQTQVGISFIYPCTEKPISYDSGFGSSERYHTVKVNNSHTYKVGLIPAQNSSYANAMVESYKTAYLAENRYIADIDMEDIYDQNMDLFKAEYTEYTFLGKVTSAGLPWQLSLPDASEKVFSFQMGFVGEQIPVGYQLYRYGLMNNDNETKKKGINIVNTWTSNSIQGTYFPAVWWDPANTLTGGSVREYPSFLRCMIDGMEGMFDAYRIAEDYGEEKEHAKWYDLVYKFANNLVKVQNADGSFYRAYNRDGSVCTDTSSSAYQGTSTLNTPIAIRFLAKMYEHTGEVKFKNAALAAAEYSYNTLYLGLEKYVGGTPDNPNTVDKEAAVYALYGFLSAYQLSGDPKYMKAAEHAAVSTMSWTYVYDFAVPNRYSSDAALNPFADGGVIGFSVIATGHSGADNFSAYTFFDMFKMYVLTEDDFYYNAALLLENDTKLSTDYDGKLGYKYSAMMPEATNVADFAFTSVGVWLPWSGVANIEPITMLQEAFGKMNIEDIKLDFASLRILLDKYGCGGK